MEETNKRQIRFDLKKKILMLGGSSGLSIGTDGYLYSTDHCQGFFAKRD